MYSELIRLPQDAKRGLFTLPVADIARSRSGTDPAPMHLTRSRNNYSPARIASGTTGAAVDSGLGGARPTGRLRLVSADGMATGVASRFGADAYVQMNGHDGANRPIQGMGVVDLTMGRGAGQAASPSAPSPSASSSAGSVFDSITIDRGHLDQEVKALQKSMDNRLTKIEDDHRKLKESQEELRLNFRRVDVAATS